MHFNIDLTVESPMEIGEAVKNCAEGKRIGPLNPRNIPSTAVQTISAITDQYIARFTLYFRF